LLYYQINYFYVDFLWVAFQAVPDIMIGYSIGVPMNQAATVTAAWV
jgi:hypothetical protein